MNASHAGSVRKLHRAAVGALLVALGVLGAPPAQAQFIGEINCGGWNFCPVGWAECNGQTLAISSNAALFSLIGTTYGGNGQTTFALPNTQGRTMVHAGQGPGLSNRLLGDAGGVEAVTLTSAQMPSHTHSVAVHAGSEQSATPVGRIPGVAAASAPLYSAAGADSTLNSAAVTSTGGSQAHNNLQPYLAMKCCISLVGIFPSRP